MEKEKRLIHLHSFLFENYQGMKKILQADPSLENLYQYTPSIFHSAFGLTPSTSEKLFSYLHTTSIQDILNKINKDETEFITIYNDAYPYLLKQIYDPPFVLYLKGKKELLLNHSNIGIIGSRKPSVFADIVCQSIIFDLIRENWTIVSGMASGCDTIAHLETIKASGNTIAVLGSGLLSIYPKENKPLYEKLSSNHLLISEYPNWIKPEKRYFPRRNRIIAGLSKGILVLEAKEQSGTMITANFALENGREVFAVPGPIIIEEYKGCHKLIQEGAKLVTSSNDILEEFI